MILNNMPDFPPEHYDDGVRQINREYNQEQKEILEKKHGRSLEDIGNLPMMSRDLIGLFICLGCGRFIETSALKYFHFDIEKARCFRCQDLHF